MNHQEGDFKGIRDLKIYYQCWLPEKDPKAVLLIVHGLAEHSGRYMNLVNHFVPLGYAIYGVDHIGHGKSDGLRVYVERFEDFTDTLKDFSHMIRDWQPKKPIFLIGHSMGGLISSIFLLDHQDELSGAVLSGPSVKVPDMSSVTILAGKLFSTLMPKLGLLALEADGVSRDPEVVKAYINDPLVYTGKITARLAAELLKAMKSAAAGASKITLPILIAQGSEDRLVDPDGAQMLHDTVGSVDKTLKIYDGLYHEIFNEPEHHKVLGDVEAWLESRHKTSTIF
ncbi:MAG: lysophospholipase [Deltaproteobacteria bacterium]|uniref:Monoacylglycerol lipase n=1 Tax=Candidatus Desulfacyla euxinica TaxID=2841693 RepID=A0A8J6N4B5_9DELT|nr:lysophospholipase [Candidatus Desulfacyla euxinica]MBL7217010.1 alpha/beta hydrolase [Desulfobacteraceae bacterium]